MSFFNADILVSGTDGLLLKDLGTDATTPSSGFGTIYVNSDVLYFKTDGGTATNLLSGGSSTTINNNADNRIITGSGTADTLNGETYLTFENSSNISTLKIMSDQDTGDFCSIATTTAGTTTIKTVDDDGGAANLTLEVDGDLVFTAAQYKTFYPSSGDGYNDFGGDGLGIYKRWGTLYCTAVNNSSDRNLKNNIQETKLGLDFIKDLKPVSYKLNSDIEDRIHYGIIAQDVIETLHKYNITDPKDYGFISGKEGKYGAYYTNFISPLIKAIQELDSKVEEQNNKISSLESKLNFQNTLLQNVVERLDKIEN